MEDPRPRVVGATITIMLERLLSRPGTQSLAMPTPNVFAEMTLIAILARLPDRHSAGAPRVIPLRRWTLTRYSL